MIAAVYARYSSALQRPTSIDDQIALCQQQAARFGCEVVDEHVYTDVELSGAVAQRPGYQQLLEAARAGAFGAILVEAQDRLWRDQAEMHAALRRLRFWDVSVFSIETGVDITDQSGRLVASVKGLMDEAYLDALREKTRRGMLGQVRRGMSPGGRPYGYRSESITDPSRADVQGRPIIVGSRRIVHPEEATVVRRIFAQYAAGWSPRAIAKQLNAEGVPPPFWRSGQTHRGWMPSAIHGQPRLATGILNNPIYIGRQIWNRTRKVRDPDTGRRVWRLVPESEWILAKVPELRIVSDELWDAVRARRDALAKHRAQGGPPPRYLLSGLLVCGVCGSAYSMIGGSGRAGRYGCTGHDYRGTCDNGHTVNREVLEGHIVRLVTDQMLAPAAVARFTRHFHEAMGRLRRSSPVDTSALHEAEAELKRIKTAIRSGGDDIPDLVQMLREAKERVESLQAQLRPTPPAADLRALPAVVERYLANLGALMRTDVARARELLRRFLGQITLQPQGNALMAVVRGDLAGVLPAGNRGAGRGI